MILYHICKPTDKGKLSEGYIGVTNNFSWRKKQHFLYNHSNLLLQNSIKKYGAIMYPISEADKETILEMEKWLRPHDNIGWNLVRGGGIPPSAAGRKWTDRQYNKIPRRGKSHHGWIGYWIIDGVEYETTREAGEALGVSRKTIRDRVKNDKYPNYNFKKD